MELKPVEWPTRTLGILCVVTGIGTWGLAGAAIVMRFTNAHNDTSSFPLIAATLGAIGTLGASFGWRLMTGRSWRVPFLRRLSGIVLLLVATIILLISLHDSDVSAWLGLGLAAGGVFLLLTWTLQPRRA